MKKGKFLLGMFRDTASVSPWRFALQYVLTILNALASARIAARTQAVFDCAGKGGEGIFSALLWLFGVYALSQAALYGTIYISQAYDTACIQARCGNIHKKIGELPVSDFNRPEILDRINGAYLGGEQIRPAVHGVMEVLTFYLPYFLVYGGYLAGTCPEMLWILPILFFPTGLAQVVKAKSYGDLEEASAPLRRQKEDYRAYTGEAVYAKETRSLGAAPFFLKQYRDVSEALNRLLEDVRKKSLSLETAAAFLNLAGYAGGVVWLVRLCLSGRLSAGAFAAVFASLGTVSEYGRELFGEKLGAIAEAYGELRQYYRFFSMEGEKRCGEQPENPGDIQLQNVSYTYPGRETPALSGIDLRLTSGETLAIVGENGSGKTTLSKILLGLYTPDSGKVIRGGKETVNPAYVRECASAVFQNFGKYPMTAEENVNLGVAADCREALGKVGLLLDGSTMLGREFGGEALSGGQWQRLAIARGMGKDGALIVLDEPTSAIDPMQEHTLYGLFLSMTRGKTGVIITHRLGLARQCDRIAVLENGRLSAEGSHEELLINCPWYAGQWAAQAGQYAGKVH